MLTMPWYELRPGAWAVCTGLSERTTYFVAYMLFLRYFVQINKEILFTDCHNILGTLAYGSTLDQCADSVAIHATCAKQRNMP